jgi:GGDEF domain-containing protein
MAEQLPDIFQHRERPPQIIGYHESGLPLHHRRTIDEQVVGMFGPITSHAYGTEEYEQLKGSVAQIYGIDVNTSDTQEHDDLDALMDDLQLLQAGEPSRGMESRYTRAWRTGRHLVRMMYAQAEAGETARQDAEVDDLTGALNRRGWLRKLESRLGITPPPTLQELESRTDITDPDAYIEECRHSKTEKPTDIALFFVDGMNFKRLNSLGQHIGDAGLRFMYREFASFPRESDVPTFGRLGGDEFAMFIPNMSQIEMDILGSRMNTQQNRKVRPDDNLYIQSWDMIFERQRQAEAAGKKLRTAVRAYERDGVTEEWLFINNEPATPFRCIVVQAIGRVHGRVESWADYEKLIEGAETRMKGVKDFLHDSAGGADRPSENGQ